MQAGPNTLSKQEIRGENIIIHIFTIPALGRMIEQSFFSILKPLYFFSRMSCVCFYNKQIFKKKNLGEKFLCFERSASLMRVLPFIEIENCAFFHLLALKEAFRKYFILSVYGWVAPGLGCLLFLCIPYSISCSIQNV